jgi:DNA-binding transcriptional LysR family regulator
LISLAPNWPAINVEFLLENAATVLITETVELPLHIGIATGSSFKMRRLAPNSTLLPASPAYLERRAAPRTLREPADHECLTIFNRRGRNTWRLQGPRGSQEVSINSRSAVNDMRVQVSACMAGLGIAPLPELIVEPIIVRGKRARVLQTDRRSSAGLGQQLVYTSCPPVRPALAVFAEIMLEKLDKGMTYTSRDQGRG